MLKRILTLSLTICFTLSLLTGGAVLAKTASKAKKELVTIRVLGSSGFFEDVTKLYAKVLEPKGIKIESEFYDWNTYDTKQKLAMTSQGGDYDVVFLPGSYVNMWAKAKAVLPMDSFMQKNKYDTNDMYDSVKKFAKVDNKFYIVPYLGEALVYYYRTDIFKKEGVKPPKTIDEMYATSKKLTKNGVYGIAYPGGPEEGSCSFWSYFLWSYGGTYFDKGWKPQLNTPSAVKSAEMFAKILKDCAPSGVTTWQNEETVAAFASGNIASCIMWPGYYSTFIDKTKSKIVGKVGVAAVPKGPSGKAVPRFGTWGLGITANCKNITAAETFIKMWTDEKGLQEVAKYTCTSSKKVNSDPKLRKANPPLAASADALNFADERPAIPESAQYISAVGNAINSIVAGKPAKGTLDTLNKKVDGIMKQAGYYK